MTDLEYGLHQDLGTTWNGEELEIDYEETAKRLYKTGYQKIIWHDAKKELPELNKNVSAYPEYVLGYDCHNQTYAVVSWDGTDWSDDNCICYNVDYWAELPKIKVEQ